MSISGLLNIAKPPGVTSRWVVDRVQRLVRPAKVGHAGTLDPLATGVLVVCVGTATRLIEYIQRMPKRYTGTFMLGRTSPTEDIDGEVTLVADAMQPPPDAVAVATRAFIGPIAQRPPAYSAVKVAGRRAYDLARKGAEVDLAPRTIEIHSIAIERYDYPELVLTIECGSGTYVRSLGRDLARALGTEAVMSALTRTAIGPFTLDSVIDPTRLDAESLLVALLPAALAVASLPAITLSAAESARIGHGVAIERRDNSDVSELAGFDAGGRLLAILEPMPDGRWKPARVFPA